MKTLSAVAALMLAAAVSAAPAHLNGAKLRDTPSEHPAQTAHPLHGNWQVRRIQAAAPAAPLTVSIRADGHFAVSGGCNGLGSSYRISGSRLYLAPAMSTLMACPDEALMQADSQIGRALAKVGRYRIKGRTLYLLDGRGKTLIEAQRQPETE